MLIKNYDFQTKYKGLKISYEKYLQIQYKKYIIICKRGGYSADKFDFWKEKHLKEDYYAKAI